MSGLEQDLTPELEASVTGDLKLNAGMASMKVGDLAGSLTSGGSANWPPMGWAVRYRGGEAAAKDQWNRFFAASCTTFMGDEMFSLIYWWGHVLPVAAVAEHAAAIQDAATAAAADEWLRYYFGAMELMRDPVSGAILVVGMRSGGHAPEGPATWLGWLRALARGEDLGPWEARGKELNLGMRNRWEYRTAKALQSTLAKPATSTEPLPAYGLMAPVHIYRTQEGLAVWCEKNVNGNTTPLMGAVSIFGKSLDYLPANGGPRIREQFEHVTCAQVGDRLVYESNLQGHAELPLPGGAVVQEITLGTAGAVPVVPVAPVVLVAESLSTAPNNVTFTASTSLMEDYRLGTEITSQTAITQLVNAAGESELFYSGSDGQGGTVIYNVRPDSTTDTGWSVTVITPDALPGQLSGGASNGVFTLFSVGPNTSNPDISYIQRSASGTWGVWTAVNPSSVFDNQTPPVQVRNIAAELVNGALELAAVLSDATGQMSLWRVDWTGTGGGWHQLGSVSSPFLDICFTLPWGEGVLGVQMNGTSPAAMDLMFFSLDGKTTAPVAAQQYFRSADSALQEPAASGVSYSGIFLYNDGLTGGPRNLSFIDCGVASPALALVDTTLTCTQIVAVPAGANPITLFALDANMRLNVISRKSASTWEPAIELGEELSLITAGIDVDGAPLVFAVDASSRNLYSMLQQPESVGGAWTKQTIEAQIQTLEKIEVYGTNLTLMDGGGNTLPNTTLSLSSPETTVVSWLEQTHVIGPNVSMTLTTNANGQVTLYTPTESIIASKLVFSVPQMDDGNTHVVHPDDGVQAQLKNITVPEVASLLPPQFQQDAGQVQQALTVAMSYTPLALPNRAVKNARFAAAAERTTKYQRAIDPSSGRVQHWRFSVWDGRATFAELTASEAAALREQLRAASPEGFFDFDWLGDITDAVSNAVESTFDYVVTTVGGAIEATIQCIINGVTYVFDGVIDTLEGAFEVVASIFSSVLVFFEALFEFLAWLLSSARQDIWNTKNYFESVINDSFPTLAALCAQSETAAAGFFASVKQEVATNFDAALASVGSDTFNYDLVPFDLAPAGAGALALSPGDIVEVILDASVKANWLMDKVSSVLGAPSFDSSLPQSVLDAFASFSNKLTSSIGQTILGEISAVGSYLTSIATNPGNFMSSTISATLTTAKNLVLSVLDVLDELTQAFFQLAIAFLQAAKTGIFDQSVGGFFLRTLYNLLNPGFPFSSEDLTVTRFVAIVCAFPTTIIYRLITGNAPFFAQEKGELVADGPNTSKMLGGLLTCTIWALVDGWLDVPQANDPAVSMKLWFGASIPVLANSLLSPGATPFSLLPSDTDVQKATNSLWCVKWAPIGYTTIFTACNKFEVGPRRDQIPCTILAAFGSAVLGTGIWKGVEESKAGTATGESWFSNIAGPLVTVAKPLRFLPPPAGTIAVLAVDAVGDIGSGVIAAKNA